MDALVTSEQLERAIVDGAAVLDASYTSTLPGSPPSDPRGDFRAARIPGARFLDLDTLADEASPLPSTVPAPEAISARLGALGISRGTPIILYDHGAHHTACRAWWVLRMGGVESSILDGGFAKWRAEGRAIESGEAAAPTPVDFPVRAPIGKLRTLADMLGNVASRAEQVADARSHARFTGEEADPRPGCGSGHIPGARSLTWGKLLHADGSWKRGAELEAVFADAGIDPARPLVASCGSGITASVIVFAAHLLGHEAALYDGSWSEWGMIDATPKAMGTA